MEKQEYQGYTGVWRRLKSGAAIFIRDGEDIQKAVRRSFNSQKLTQKRKEIIEKEDDAFQFEQQAKRNKLMAFREKGELSKDYEEAYSRERSYKQEQDRLRQERYNVEDEQQRMTARNRFGMQIKKDQVDQLKKVGNAKQNLSDLRKAIKEHNEQNALSSELDLGDQKAKFTDVYGYESMKDASQKIAGRLEQEKFGTYQAGQKVMIEDSYGGKPREAEVVREMNETDSRMLYGGAVIGYVVKDQYGEFNSNNRRMTPKQKAEAIKKANSYTSQELKDKYGTDNVELINAGKEAKDRVSLKESDVDNKTYKEVEAYYRNMATENVATDLDIRARRLERGLYAPNDIDKYKAWNKALEKYLRTRY